MAVALRARGLVSACALVLAHHLLWGQNVAINTTGAAPRDPVLLDVVDGTKGLLIPRISLSATNIAAPVASPANGLFIYNTATTSFTGSAAQFNVTPGFYLWDANGARWVRHEALVRRPAVHTATGSVTTTGSAWSTVPGMTSPAMALLAGDRVEMKAYGTAATAALGDAEGLVELAVDDGGGAVVLPNGSGHTAFSIDNGSQVLSGNTMARFTPYHSWSVSGYYDVPVNGTYTFLVRFSRAAGSVNMVCGSYALPGGANAQGALIIETIRP